MSETKCQKMRCQKIKCQNLNVKNSMSKIMSIKLPLKSTKNLWFSLFACLAGSGC